jgi:CRP-like cAMP-binding protein
MRATPPVRPRSFKCKTCRNRSCAIAALNEAELELLSEKITETYFQPGEPLFKEEALNAHIIYIQEGLVKIHLRATRAKDCILKLAPAPAYLGLATIFGDSVNRFSATALEPTTACFIDVSTFKHLILTNGQFAHEIIAEVSRDELRLYRRFAQRMHQQIPGRLAGTLLFFAEKVYQAATFELPFTRTELAEYIGASRESVTRQLALLKADGMIEVDKNHIAILKMDSLKRIEQAG